MENKELTLGEQAIGINFESIRNNPGSTTKLEKDILSIKQTFADLINTIDVAGDVYIKTTGKKPSWIYNVLRTQSINMCISASMAVVKFLYELKN